MEKKLGNLPVGSMVKINGVNCKILSSGENVLLECQIAQPRKTFDNSGGFKQSDQFKCISSELQQYLKGDH